MMEKPADALVPCDQTAELVLSACQGDANAFGLLVMENERTLYRVAHTVLHTDHDCADAVQEALTKAWLSIKTLREPRFFRTWLIRILLNECYRHLRNNKRLASQQEPPDQQTNEGIPAEAIDLKNALAQLPPHHRITIVLFHVEDLDVKEIANVMHVPTGTVKSRLARARAKLAAQLQ